MRPKKKNIAELGYISFFCELGKYNVKLESLLEKNQKTNIEISEQRKIFNNVYSFLLESCSFNELWIKKLTVAFEYSMNLKSEFEKGMPTYFMKMVPNPISQILSLSRLFTEKFVGDANHTGLCGEELFLYLQEKVGSEINSLLYKVLVNEMGLLPIGTMVELTSGEKGVVYKFPEKESDIKRPHIKILFDDQGRKIAGLTVDLSEKDKQGKYKKSIKRSFNAEELNLNIPHLFLL